MGAKKASYADLHCLDKTLFFSETMNKLSLEEQYKMVEVNNRKIFHIFTGKQELVALTINVGLGSRTHIALW